ncbi:MAG TPA: hypothetical protein VIU93_12050, partial [Gallionellaceae bacterium]
DYALTLIEGEELMFTMEVPNVPAPETPIVLAQAATMDTTSQPDYLLKLCKQTESIGDSRSAMRAVDPAGMLALYLERNKGAQYIDLKSIKTTLLEGVKHGEIISGTTNTGRTAYRYDAEPEYVGNDRAVFMAEFEGKRYKIVIDLKVFLEVNENAPSACPPPRLIKVNGKPVSGSLTDLPTAGSDLSSWLSMEQLDGLMADAVTVTVADLPGGALGQTSGTGIDGM